MMTDCVIVQQGRSSIGPAAQHVEDVELVVAVEDDWNWKSRLW